VQLGRLGGFCCGPGAHHVVPATAMAGPEVRGWRGVMMAASSRMVADQALDNSLPPEPSSELSQFDVSEHTPLAVRQ
jgi:hypothetical protein